VPACIGLPVILSRLSDISILRGSTIQYLGAQPIKFEAATICQGTLSSVPYLCAPAPELNTLPIGSSDSQYAFTGLVEIVLRCEASRGEGEDSAHNGCGGENNLAKALCEVYQSQPVVPNCFGNYESGGRVQRVPTTLDQELNKCRP
jgi:hypothetical protein